MVRKVEKWKWLEEADWLMVAGGRSDPGGYMEYVGASVSIQEEVKSASR